MPDETTQQRAERQSRLSHAMGVMFLQDKVDKLERDVSKIAYPRGIRQSKSALTPDLAPSNSRPHRQSPQPRAITEPGIPAAQDTTTDQIAQTARKGASSIRLIDASVLIFSLRSVHNWSRDQSTCVIIPLEAINTLDLLKKGDEPINLAARKATRWLEEKIAISSQDGDEMLTQPMSGIFAQKESFRMTQAQLQEARLNANSLASSDSSTEGPASTDMFAPAEAPRYLRELLSTCLYCKRASDTSTDSSDFAVAIAYPPAHLQDKMIGTSSSPTSTYLTRTDGRATEAWLKAYHIPLDLAPTSKTWTGEKISSRFHAEHLGPTDDVKPDSIRRKGSPTPSIASSTSSFRSELSSGTGGGGLFGSHRSPHHRHEPRFAAPSRSQVRCLSTFSPVENDDELEGPIIARPSSAASQSSFVSTMTSSTIDDASSQTSAAPSSGSSARIVRHGASALGDGPLAESSASRLTKGTLHKTKSGAVKMEDYLRRLEAGGAGGGNERTATSTPTPR